MSHYTRNLVTWIRYTLRNTFIHNIYEFIRYDLPVDIIVRLMPNIRRGRYNKIYKLLKYRGSKIFNPDIPKQISLDTVSMCNLKCPLCSVPFVFTKQKDKYMPPETFCKIVDNLDMGIELILVYSGECLLHPDLLTFAKSTIKDWYVSTVTNGTLLTAKKVDHIVREGLLDFLHFSFDGWTKESYEKYRVGADFDQTKAKLLYLLHAKTDLPYVTVRYLMTSYSENEANKAEKDLMKANLDKFQRNPINLAEYHDYATTKETNLHWLPKESNITYYDRKGDCKDRSNKCNISLHPVIRCDGEVILCCVDVKRSVKIGNVLDQKFSTLWNSKHYKKIRQKAKAKQLPVCRRCMK